MKTLTYISALSLLSTGLAIPTNSYQTLEEARCGDELTSSPTDSKSLNNGLMRRKEFNVNMAFGAALASGQFAYMAAGTCPGTAAEEDVNKAQCGISATISVFAGFFAVYQVGGLVVHDGPTTTRRSIKRENLPYEDESLIHGYRTTFDYHGTSPEADGSDWHHYTIRSHHLERDHVSNITAMFHPHEDRQYVSVPVSADQGTMLGKRQSFPVATYGWTAEDQYYYDNSNIDQSVIDRIGLATWNNAHDQNLQEFCADVQADDGTRWNKGYYALKSGVFSDMSSQC